MDGFENTALYAPRFGVIGASKRPVCAISFEDSESDANNTYSIGYRQTIDKKINVNPLQIRKIFLDKLSFILTSDYHKDVSVVRLLI